MAVIVHYRGDLPCQADADLVLDDHDVLPSSLAAATADMDHIEISDPLSFPFEDLPLDRWSTPMTIHLPDLGFDVVTALLDEPVLSRLTVVDSVSATDQLWDRLHPRYGWPQSMRVGPYDLDLRHRVDLAATAGRLADEDPTRSRAGFAVRSCQNKRWIGAVSEAIRSSVDGHLDSLARTPSVHLCGWGVQPYILPVWNWLTTVVEHRPVGAQRLYGLYRRPPFALVDPAAPVPIETADVVIGTDLAETGGDLTQAYRQLFRRARVGGMIVIAEQFHRGLTPNGLIERLLDASGHDLVLNSVEPLGAESSEPLDYAVLAMTKLGVPSRL